MRLPRIIRLLSHYIGICDHPEPWEGPPNGYYVSDADASIAYFRNSPHFTKRQVDILSRLVGKVIVDHRETETWSISLDSNFVKRSEPSRVRRRGRNFLITQDYDNVWQHTSKTRVIQDRDGYWVVTSKLVPHYRERFQAMSEDAFAEATQHLRKTPDGALVESEYTEELLTQVKSAKRQIAKRKAITYLMATLVGGTTIKGIYDLLREYIL